MISSLLSLSLGLASLSIETSKNLELPREGGRTISYSVTAPTTGGPYPVIIFSHGMYGSEEGNTPLAEAWAKDGFVVIRPTHADSMRYADEATRQNFRRGQTNNASNWRERPGEISYLIDSLKTIEKQLPKVAGKLDRQVIGVGGHSYGAWTTQMVAGMELGRGGMKLALGDSRPKAFISLAPHGLTEGVTPESLAKMRGPMLMISGDNDHSPGKPESETAAFRTAAYKHSPSDGGRYLLWIKDAFHNFGGATGSGGASDQAMRALGHGGPESPEIASAVRETTLHFWRATLKKDPAAQRWLDGKEIEKDGISTLSHK
ncbi:MAG: hypothetical protein LCH41_00615 [Armatimonadetes bacterium]|nr:hypothetical protein [Armatimonadota bacterium]